jgi:DNA-binding HxlR family transcriptional regulator
VATRSYAQLCPVASALDSIGDRWTLLVVRELLLGPRRFGELASALPGVGTDILTARLRALEADDVVSRTDGVRPSYVLTEEGRGLASVLRELARWGAPRLAPPDSLDEAKPRLALTTLLMLSSTPLPACDGTFEVRTGDEVAHVRVRGGKITALQDEETSTPHTSIELTRFGLVTLLLGGRTRDLVQSGDIVMHGDRRAGLRLLDALAKSSPMA